MIVQFVARELWRHTLQHVPWFDAPSLDIGNTVPLVQPRGLGVLPSQDGSHQDL